MRILLDENFPLALLWKLQEEGHEVDHIILLGLRGATDRAIVDRLKSEDLLLLTQDQEFLDLPSLRRACHRLTRGPESAHILADRDLAQSDSRVLLSRLARNALRSIRRWKATPMAARAVRIRRLIYRFQREICLSRLRVVARELTKLCD